MDAPSRRNLVSESPTTPIADDGSVAMLLALPAAHNPRWMRARSEFAAGGD